MDVKNIAEEISISTLNRLKFQGSQCICRGYQQSAERTPLAKLRTCRSTVSQAAEIAGAGSGSSVLG